MKKVILMFSALFVLCLFTSQARALNIDFVLSDPNIIEGESFSIDVWARGVFDDVLDPFDELLAFGFDVTNSDASVAQFDSWMVGPLFNDDSLFFPDTDIAGSIFPGLTLVDGNEFLLASLDFTALSVGDVTLGIFSDPFTLLSPLGDLNEGLIYFMEGNVDITESVVVAVASIPEPGTVFLMIVGMVSIAGLRRRGFLGYGERN